MANKCLIISTYFGERRAYPHNEQGTVEYFNKYLSFLINLDSGTDSDIIIANHEHSNNKEELKTSLEYLYNLNNTKTKNGFLKTISRPWENGIGGSHKSYDHVFNLFKNQYDFWFFSEDDAPITQEGYFSNTIKQLDSDEQLAFICTFSHYFGGLTLTGSRYFLTKEDYNNLETFKLKAFIPDKNGTLQMVRNCYDIHCHGGLGVTHTKYLQKVVDNYGHLPYHKSEGENFSYVKFQDDGEIRFTNVLAELGFVLQMYDGECIQPHNNKPIIIEGDSKLKFVADNGKFL